MLDVCDSSDAGTAHGDKDTAVQSGDAENEDELGIDQSSRDRFRVKVLQSKNQSPWETLGIGYVDCLIAQKEEAPRIVVKSEQDDDLIINKPILEECKYSVEQDTILTWSGQDDVFYALSFQNVSTCQHLRDLIQKYLIRNRGIDTDYIEKVSNAESIAEEDFVDILNVLAKSSDLQFGFQLSLNLLINGFIDKASKRYHELNSEDTHKGEKIKAIIKDIFKFICSAGDTIILTEITNRNNYESLIEIISDEDMMVHHDVIKRLSEVKARLDYDSVGCVVNTATYLLKLENIYRCLFDEDIAKIIAPCYLRSAICAEEDNVARNTSKAEFLRNVILNILMNVDECEPTFQACVDLIEIISKSLPKFSLTTRIVDTIIRRTYTGDDIIVPNFIAFIVKYIRSESIRLRRLASEIARDLISKNPEIIKEQYSAGSNVEERMDFVGALTDQFLSEQNAGLQVFLSDIILDLTSFNSEIPASYEVNGVTKDDFTYYYCKYYFPKLYSIFTSPKVKQILSPGDEELTLDKQDEFLVNFLCNLVTASLGQDEHRKMCVVYFLSGNLKIVNALIAFLKYGRLYIRIVCLLALKALLFARISAIDAVILSDDTICTILDALEKTLESKNAFYSACLNMFDLLRKQNVVHAVKSFAVIIDEKYPHLLTNNVISLLVLKKDQNKRLPPHDTDTEDAESDYVFSFKPKASRYSTSSAEASDMIDPLEEEYFSTCDDDIPDPDIFEQDDPNLDLHRQDKPMQNSSHQGVDSE